MSCWYGRRAGASFGKAWRGSRVALIVTAMLLSLEAERMARAAVVVSARPGRTTSAGGPA